MSLRIAMSSYTGYGAWFTRRLLTEGHKVDYYLSEDRYANVLNGIVPAPFVLQKGSQNYPYFHKYDLSLFDLTGRQRMAEYSRKNCPTIGDGIFNCRAEDDRFFGLETMEEAGIKVPPYEKFTDPSAAKAFVLKNKKRYVYKPNGGQDNDTDTTYVASSPEDMVGNIDKLFAKTKGAPFILQEFISGTEISVEGWFNGTEFYLVNATLEEKKFMNDNHGPNTGCAGNLVFLLDSSTRLFTEGLGKMKDILTQSNYQGMIDLNTIATPDSLYGLEWTPRFGYDASATLFNMYSGDLGQMFYDVATCSIPSESWRADFGAGVRLSIPPYPTEIKGKHPEGLPIKGIDEKFWDETYMFDIYIKKKELVTAGHSGLIAVPLTCGRSIGDAWDDMKKRLEVIKIPNMQYRTDIEKTTTKRYNELKEMGYLKC